MSCNMEINLSTHPRFTGWHGRQVYDNWDPRTPQTWTSKCDAWVVGLAL